MKVWKLFFVLLIGLISILGLRAQVQVTNSAPFNNPDHLVQNVLLGPGVPFVPSFPAPPPSVQIGKFTNGNSFGFGIDSGIVMVSGNATDAAFPCVPDRFPLMTGNPSPDEWYWSNKGYFYRTAPEELE